MSRSEFLQRRRFFRNRDRAKIAGVCAGIADYFGFNLRATRLLAIICLITAMPFTLLVYFAVVFLFPAGPDPARRPEFDEAFHKSVRANPAQTLSDIKRRFQSLDGRLARLERYVTSPRFDLEQEFRNL